MTDESLEAARAEYQRLYEEHAALEREMAGLGRSDVPLQDPDHVLQRSEAEQLAWWSQVGDLHRLSRELLAAWHEYETQLHASAASDADSS
ncbi:MAG: hypothetical protein JWO63_849 [Frankiales bacterium]|jgi:hypothetical protein|nr:hypothetical protein [Frankiales bacterium]